MGGLFLVAVVLVGLFFFFAPRDEVAAPEAREGGAVTGEEYERERYIEDYAEGRYTGEVSASERGDVIDSLSRGLVLVNYSYDRQADEVSGSVMNNTRQPFVGVQLAFRLLDAQDDSIGAVRQVMGEIGPSATQRFVISIPREQPVTSVTPTELSATLKDVAGMQRDPNYPQNDVPGMGGEEGVPEEYLEDEYEPEQQ